MDFASELPAASGARPARWQTEADECRSRPGQWGRLTTFTLTEPADHKRIGSHARMVAHHVRTGRYVAFRPAGAYEATTRLRVTHTVEDSRVHATTKWSVYVRYVGDSREGY
jgi:hypothetical protein